jgi:cysteine desulfurase
MIYLDNNATTCVDPAVRDAMLPWLDDHYGNPSAGYRFGKESRKAIESAREKVAALIGAHPEEIVFTSGGTESNNAAIRSALSYTPEKSLLTTAAEHSAVFEIAESLDEDLTVSDPGLNPVRSSGIPCLVEWKEALASEKYGVASMIWANNETGVISPVAEAAELAAEHKVYFHTDAVQAVGKIPVDVGNIPIHALSLSAHKMHGPKGIGALYLNRHSRFHPSVAGGGQENNRRSGTENVPGIVGLGIAAELAASRLEEAAKISSLRDRFETRVIDSVEGIEANGAEAERLPNTSNLYFSGVDGEGLLILLDEAGVCCSPGSACSTGSVQPSRIIRAMGHSSSRARSSVRFSLSRHTAEEEIDEAIAIIEKAVSKLRVVLPSGNRVISSTRRN